ncbi:MAG: hypothetical protein PVSMB4_05690 [Ktedonobacterales bacterium]
MPHSYDPAAEQFTFADTDTVLPGNGYDPLDLSRYAYVDVDGHGFGPCARCASAR